MSCFPKDRREEEEPDLLKAAKLLRYAKFAMRFQQSQSMPDLQAAKRREAATARSKKNRSVPRYMRPSKAALRRQEENEKRLNVIAGKQEEQMVEDKRRLADKIVAAEAELEKLRLREAELSESKSQPIIVVKSEEEGPTGEEKRDEEIEMPAVVGERTLHLMADEDDLKKQQMMPGLTLSAPMPKIASPIKSVADDKKKKTKEEGNVNSPPQLTGDGRSFTFKSETIMISKMAAKRCFRVLTYRDLPNGKREVMDIPEGSIYLCKTGPQNRRITPGGVAFDTKDGAMSERFPINQVAAAKSGNGTSPRILVSFDCWGKAARRLGGAGAARYQYCKFNKIVAFLDAPKTVSKKNVEHPIRPNYYPRADRRPVPRSPIDKAIYLDKMFNTRPWTKPEDERPFTPEFKLDSIKPQVPSHKVPRRVTDD